MEDNTMLVETLLVKATNYGKTSFKLVKLNALDKTTDVVSSIIPHLIVLIITSTSILFINLALALWIGELIGDVFYGFLLVGAFYALVTLVFHFLLRNKLKRIIGDYIIKLVLN
ncbi:MAG: hypothetical protein P4L28_07510 [Paludibacteraceae bacterium]|nr:hypothetical protein [Paludibacteraceae bacterium]